MMSAQSSPKSPDFEGFTEDDITADYIDPHENVLYSTTSSEKTFSLSIKFFSDTTFSAVCKSLKAVYAFTQNKNKSGLESHIKFVEKNVAIHVYPKTTSLHIQGAGCFLWRNHIFRKLSAKLNDATSIEGKSPEIHTTPRTSRVRNQELEQPTAVTHQDTPHPHIKSPLMGLIDKLRQKVKPKASTIPQVLADDPIEISPAGSTDDVTMCPNTTDPDITHVKKIAQAQYTEQSKLQHQYTSLKEENEHLRTQSNKILTASRLLREQGDILESTNEALKSEILTLKCALSDTNAKLLVTSDEVTKLKETNKNLTSDNKKLSAEKQRTDGRATVANIETVISSLTDKMMDEFSQLKQQLERQQDLITDKNQQVSSNARQPDMRPETNRGETSTRQPEKLVPNVYVTGDSIVSALSTRRLSDDKMNVKIQTHPGARIINIENSFVQLNHKDHEYATKLDATVIHVGTNNVAEADPPETVVRQVRDLVDTVKQTNPNIHVVISSILPRKRDKLVNNAIDNTNRELKDMCNGDDIHFLDNTPQFKPTGEPDNSLYRNDIHLNARGGFTLGENIKKKLSVIFNIPHTNEQYRYHPKDNFGAGRNIGRRQINQANYPADPGQNNMERQPRYRMPHTQGQDRRPYPSGPQLRSRREPEYSHFQGPDQQRMPPQMGYRPR